MSGRRSDAFSEAEVATLREIVAQLDAQDERCGGWSSKIDARQTGFSLHIKFDKKVDIMQAITVANIFEQSSTRLYQIVDRVLGQIEAGAEAPA